MMKNKTYQTRHSALLFSTLLFAFAILFALPFSCSEQLVTTEVKTKLTGGYVIQRIEGNSISVNVECDKEFAFVLVHEDGFEHGFCKPGATLVYSNTDAQYFSTRIENGFLKLKLGA